MCVQVMKASRDRGQASGAGSTDLDECIDCRAPPRHRQALLLGWACSLHSQEAACEAFQEP